MSLFDPGLLTEGGNGDPELFRNPEMLEAGTLPMTPLSGGPWYATLDVGLRKYIPLPFSTTARAQLRFDFFNILNRTNFDVGTRQNPNSTEFGLISEAFSAREIQVGMKLTF